MGEGGCSGEGKERATSPTAVEREDAVAARGEVTENTATREAR